MSTTASELPLADLAVPPKGPPNSRPRFAFATVQRPFRSYLLALTLVGGGLLVARAVDGYATVEDEAMISLLTGVMTALLFEMRIALLATLGNILAFDFFFVPPRYAFARSDIKNALTFLAILLVALVVSGLSQRLRKQGQAARLSARIASALYELNTELATASQPSQMWTSAKRHIEQLFSGDVCILLPTVEGLFEPPPGMSAEATALAERAWARRECSVGPTPSDYHTWVPVLGIQQVLGVVGLRTTEPFSQQSAQARLLGTFACELATALERARLAGVAHRCQVDAESERVRNTLLSAISHDLKTPLSAIVTAATSLMAHGSAIEAHARDELLSGIAQEGERLTRQIQNLLSITRLESPTIELRRSAQSFEEILATTLERFEAALGNHALEIDIDPALPLVFVEAALIEQVLSNLIENALHHADGSPELSVTARAASAVVVVQVADRGRGVPEEERDKVFEKFYRGSHGSKHDGGVGLGLTFCRAVVRAHGGTISLRSRPQGGTVVEFTLPAVGQEESSCSSGLGET